MPETRKRIVSRRIVAVAIWVARSVNYLSSAFLNFPISYRGAVARRCCGDSCLFFVPRGLRSRRWESWSWDIGRFTHNDNMEIDIGSSCTSEYECENIGDDNIPSFDDSLQADNEDDILLRATFINGTSQGLVVTKYYNAPLEGFPAYFSHDGATVNAAMPESTLFTVQDRQRLDLTPSNITLPVALMILDPASYPSQSRARKAIRRRSICIHRHNGQKIISCANNAPILHFNELGKVLSRIYPGDIIGFQRRIGNDYYSLEGIPYRPPPFHIPVIYEDDHMAIVNKPPGVVLYRADSGKKGSTRGGGHGMDTLLSALPHVLTPSSIDDVRWRNEGHVPLKRRHPVHRLDRPTSGLVVVAKTKFAAVHLAQQFELRKVAKTYMAIVNGYPRTGDGRAFQKDKWHTIDCELDGKSAVTEWKIVREGKSLRGKDGVLTLVEMKPKTGRYHQLRRHFAWMCNSPIVGDSIYDEGNKESLRLRQRGLFLCSNAIEIEHPFFNTPLGQQQWKDTTSLSSKSSPFLRRDEASGRIVVNAIIDLPDKFQTFLARENERVVKLQMRKSR